MEDVVYPEYTALAEIYDAVMKNVDYQIWADFIDEIIQLHHPEPQAILELACGTGSLSLELDRYNCYKITGTDKSEKMIAKARKKASIQNASVIFKPMNFLDNTLSSTYDIIVSIFDSINYLSTGKEINRLLAQTKKVMDKHSLFIFDFTTPENSLQAIPYLNNEEGSTANNYRFFRTSQYDAEQQIHYNTFDIKKIADDGESVLEQFTEKHKQRAYSLTQMQQFIEETDFEIVAQYSEFDLDEATSESLRITMVLRCPDTQ